MADPKRDARLRKADRQQMAWGRIDLDAQLPGDHAARAIWSVIDRLDLSALYAQVKARGEEAGAPAIDPKILLALWVFATSEGEGSAREIWRLTSLHAAYRWICGGVDVGYHTLSDFRSEQGTVIDDLITQVLALLMRQDLVDLSRVAQDGTRIRASAGAASFRREQTLQSLMQAAREHLEAVTKECADPAFSARRAAARKRGARERIERLEAALAQIPEVARVKQRNGAKEKPPRVSTTDPDARVMKMGDGGFRPAFNVQFATTTDDARVIVGVEVTNRGSDAGESTPMIGKIEGRTGVRPKEMLVDGGYPQHDAIDAAAQQQVTLYAPVPKPREGSTRDPHAPCEGDSEAVAAWRQRMGTDEAKEIYKERAATAETVNADGKTHRGLDHLVVRGLVKVSGSALLFALTYNILRTITLGG
ncbi:MAG: IS1182 family transposase [Mycolicibacterium neoaurum]|nr:IS1182 family transposase [Mycolicibacterium neoaurum]